jgi:hypothetical protein
MRARTQRSRGCPWALWILIAAAPGCDPGNDTADAGAGTGTPAKDTGAATDAGKTDAATGDAIVAPKPDAASTSKDASPTPTDATMGTGDSALPPPPEETAVPPLFGPDAPGATPLDEGIGALVGAWYDLPTDAETALSHAEKWREAQATVREGGAAAADRITDVCAAVPLHNVQDTLVCHRLLTLVDSPRSLDLLASRARLAIPPWPEGAHPTDPAPEDLARQTALDALALRSRAGTTGAADLLLRIVVAPEGGDRPQAVSAVFRALPRAVAKRRLKAALPAEQMYLLYQDR